jgi:carboxylesterase
MPDEMRSLGDHLAGLGHTVLGVRLAGHGTQPRDLSRTRYSDWLLDVEDGLALLTQLAQSVVIIGQSLGGMVALTAAASYPIDGVVAISTPFGSPRRRWCWRLESVLPRLARKPVAVHPELGLRREAEYPAYAAFPTRIVRELERLDASLRKALPAIDIPVLVIQSKADPWVPVADAERIYERLQAADRRMLLVENLGHSLVLDPKRAEIFEAVAAFVDDVSR